MNKRILWLTFNAVFISFVIIMIIQIVQVWMGYTLVDTKDKEICYTKEK